MASSKVPNWTSMVCFLCVNTVPRGEFHCVLVLQIHSGYCVIIGSRM